ncbi:hypothetical protein D3C75_1377930 [compost metagenome]
MDQRGDVAPFADGVPDDIKFVARHQRVGWHMLNHLQQRGVVLPGDRFEGAIRLGF